jgi:hydroxymethylbilane synthase
VLAALGGGCQLPVGAFAEGGDVLYLTAVVVAPNGSAFLRSEHTGALPQELGDRVAAELASRGAHHLLKAC